MVKFYTIECPKCKVLEMKLKQSKLDYEKIDDVDQVVKVGTENGIMGAPFIEAEGKFYTFADAVKYVNGVINR